MGSCKNKKRVARGYGGKGGGTGGRGTRGQKSRTGGGVRPGFEGGQTPLYRRLPKLKGMTAGSKKFVIINLDDQENAFVANETVTIGTLETKGVLKSSGRDRKLPLKVLGRGSLLKPLTVKAAAFSRRARASTEAAGGKVEIDTPVVKSSR